MNTSVKLLTPTTVGALVERLSRVSSVARFDEPGEPQAATLAHSLSDMEDSFRVILETLLPKLLDKELLSDEANDVLLDIGEELRHVLYHIKDPRFFRYLFDGDDGV